MPDGPTSLWGARPCLDHDRHMKRCVWKLGIPDLMAILVGELMINVLFVLTPCSESKGFSMARWDCRNAGYPEFSQMLHFCRTHSTTLQWINDPKQDQYGLVVHLWVKFPESGHSQLGHHSGVITKDLHCYIVLPSLESWLVRGILPLFLALFQVSESL